MKKIFHSLYVMIIIVFGIQAKTIVAVMPFSSSGANANTTELLQESLTDALVNSNRYSVVERVELNKAMKELSLQNSDEFDDQYAGEIGKMLGAEIVFFGRVIRLEEKFHISLRGVKPSSGEIVCSQKAVANSSNEFMSVCTRICNEVAKGRSTGSVLAMKFSRKELRLIDKLENKWGIDLFDKKAMALKRNGYLAAGIVLACFIVFLPWCGAPFYRAYQISKIYKKATGQTLTYNDAQFEAICAYGKKKMSFEMSIVL